MEIVKRGGGRSNKGRMWGEGYFKEPGVSWK